MPNVAQKLKREIAEAVPAVLFFLVAFNILAATKALFLLEHGLKGASFVNATFLALVVGKVILIADKIPFINRYPDKPLIHNTVWKTLIYISVTIVVKIVERLIPAIYNEGSFVAGWHHMAETVVWPHFLAVLLWLSLLLFTFAALRELGRLIGREKVMKMFFGPTPATDLTS